MLDVHPPHHAVGSWRDFFTHILTITIGLLIALGLEAAVEAMHHRHVVREAKENLHEEIRENKELAARDRVSLEADRNQLQQDMSVLRAIRNDPKKPHLPIAFHWQWSSPASAALQTARDTGALALMPTSDVEGYAVVYQQQENVRQQALVFIANQMHIEIPIKMQDQGDIAALSPTQIDEIVRSCALSLSDIEYLEALMDGLDHLYSNALSQL